MRSQAAVPARTDRARRRYSITMDIEAIPSRFLRLRQVLDIVGLSKSAVYARIKEGTFPKAVSLGGTSVAWVETEVIDWMNARIVASPDGEARLRRANMKPPSAGVRSRPDRITVQSPPQPVKPKRDDAERKRAEDRRRHDAKLDALLSALRDYLIYSRVSPAE